MDGPGFRHHQETFIAAQVRGDRLRQLFNQSVSAVFGSYLAALMLCGLCWERMDHNVMIGWIGLLSASSLLRILMFVVYFRSPDSERTPQRWERIYWVTLVLSAGIWGAGALAVMPSDDLLAQALVMLFAVGMSVSAVSCYSSYRYMTLVSIGLVLLPCTTWLVFQPTTLQVGMALAVVVFASFVARATRKLSEALETAFRLTREMELAHRIATHAAQTDELTGLKNRRAFLSMRSSCSTTANTIGCRCARSCSIWITSSTSMTLTAIRLAIRYCARWEWSSAPVFVKQTSTAGWVARNSPSCCRTRPLRSPSKLPST